MRRVGAPGALLPMLVTLGILAAPGTAAAQTPVGDGASDVGLAGWLAGCWAAEAGSSRTEEHWMAPDGGLMVGMSRSVRDGRARGWEHLLLGARDGVLTYSALPSGQALTHFPLVRAAPDLLRFENPGHDFPGALEYQRVGADSLRARVFAGAEDAEPAFVLRYARKRCPP